MKDKEIINEIKQDFKTHEEKCKQIEEMAKDWDYVAHMLRFNDRYMLSLKQWSEPAREMIKLGWINLPKDSVILSKEELCTIQANFFDSGIKYGSKETAEKILNDMYRYNGSLFGTCFHKGHYVSDVRSLVKDIAEESKLR